MKRLFWKVYQAEFTSVDGKEKNIQWFRGITWEVILLAQKEAKNLTEKNKTEFALSDLKLLK